MLGDVMKQTRIYLLFICFCLFFGGKNVLAKEVSKTCKYTYVNELTENGNTDTVAANRGGTITLSVYTDGSQDGQGKSNGTFLAENFGGHEEILNWAKSDNDFFDKYSDYYKKIKRYAVLIRKGNMEIVKIWKQ